MFIINQDKTEMINLDNVTTIELSLLGDGNTNEIYASLIDDSPTTLGVYITKDRAREVFEKIIQNCGAINVFYMPKE